MPEKTVCTEQALDGLGACLFKRCERYEPVFCRIVNDQGRHKAESCTHVNCAAEARLPASRKSEPYRCHADLLKIAVPVICEGQDVAVLLTGQVLLGSPSEAGGVRIGRSRSWLTYIDSEALDTAYWEVPAVSAGEIEITMGIVNKYTQSAELNGKPLNRLCIEHRDIGRRHAGATHGTETQPVVGASLPRLLRLLFRN